MSIIYNIKKKAKRLLQIIFNVSTKGQKEEIHYPAIGKNIPLTQFDCFKIQLKGKNKR